MGISESMELGYCINVYVGFDLGIIWDNFCEYVVVVKEWVLFDDVMGIGFWFFVRMVENLMND